MNNSIPKTVAAISLVLQIAVPVWWATVVASFYYFWVEAVIEGGIFGAERVMGVDHSGNSIIGMCVMPNHCSFVPLLWGLFSIYSIFAIVISIYSLFFLKKQKIIFSVINILTIVGVALAIVLNGGILPRF